MIPELLNPSLTQFTPALRAADESDFVATKKTMRRRESPPLTKLGPSAPYTPFHGRKRIEGHGLRLIAQVRAARPDRRSAREVSSSGVSRIMATFSQVIGVKLTGSP